MKRLLSVCMMLALVATAAFASYKKEDVQASQKAAADEMTIEKAMLYYEAGLELTPAMKAMVSDYLSANEVRGEAGTLDNVGGPDGFGYRWVDNQAGDTVVYGWIELCNDALATAVSTSGDDVTTLIPFGLNFPYYGTVYTQGWASSNGMLSLNVSNNAWTNVAISATNTNSAIYVYWDDMLQTAATIGQCGLNGKMFYRNFGDYTVIEWSRFDPFSGTGLTSVEAIIWNTGMIKLQWNTPDYTHTSVSATVGIEAPLADGLQYIHNTAGIVGGRAVVFYPPMQAPVGRCCYVANGAGTCGEYTVDECLALGGQWGGAGTTCTANPCPVGRCCYDGGAACVDVIQAECNFLGGAWTAGLSCATNPCPRDLQGSDECVDGPMVTLGQTYVGTTVGATGDPAYAGCGGYNGTALGVWYSVLGTGNAMTVSLCDLVSFDTRVVVICGDCNAATCVGGNDDFCSLGSQFSWCSQAGAVYHILVTAFSASSGPYTILVTDDGIPCSTAINCFPSGRCCYTDPTGAPSCATVTAAECDFLGGEFNAEVTCESAPCYGSCCYVIDNPGFCEDQSHCVDGLTADACALLGGAWNAGGSCEGTVCPSNLPCVCRCGEYPNSHSTLAADETTYPVISFAPATCLTVNVPIEYSITDLNVSIDFIHTFDGDVAISITSPMGTTVVLSAFNGGAGDNYLCTTFDDEATTAVSAGFAPFNGSYIPDAALSAFDGENAVGNWVVCFDDQVGGDDGYVIGACLVFEYDRILPVAFGSFDAVSGDAQVTLNWNTESESSVESFEVLRDGAKVGEVAAQNSSSGANYSYVDNGLTNGVTYSYTLVSVDLNGDRATLATQSATPTGSAVVTEYALHQNYPNPFNPTTNIAFDMVEAGNVSISIFNVMGQKVAEIVNGNVASGRHVVSFDATGLSSGLYLYKMEANGFTAQAKMVLMK